MTDDALDAAAAIAGRPYGMTPEQMITHLAMGDIPHPDAPPDVCGATDPRDDTAWCKLAPRHPGEGHNRYAPGDGCRTWTAHEQHDPDSRL